MKALAEPLRFAAVGAAASATHVAVGLSLERFAHLLPWSANIAAFAVALLVSYLGNSLVTFKVDARRADAFAKFALVSGLAFAINQSIVMALTGLGWTYAMSLAVVVLTVPVMTYLAAKHWALR